jgi:hypothetical protein
MFTTCPKPADERLAHDRNNTTSIRQHTIRSAAREPLTDTACVFEQDYFRGPKQHALGVPSA